MNRPQSVHEARRHANAVTRRQLDFLRYTPMQRKFLTNEALIVLLRGGNQCGKTLALHADLIHTARHTHPYQKPIRGPVRIVVLSESWDQMGQAGGFMQKLWALLPKSEIDPKIRFEPGRGITGKPPRIVFTDGPGKGSIISFGTYRRGSAVSAGSTIHRVYLDEPPPSSIYEEMMVRILREGGKCRIGFTPVLNMPDQTWLRQLVDAGDIIEYNPHLTEANCWPTGSPTPWLTQPNIDRLARSLPEAIRAMRLEGSWDPVLTHKWLTNYDASKHVLSVRPPAGAYLGVGIDHGTNAGKQAAVLFAAIHRKSMRPIVWFLDEAIGDGRTSYQQDAEAILEMLERNGYRWSDIDQWIGDRPTGEDRYLVQKSNNRLRQFLAYLSKVNVGAFPKIAVPHKWSGSVEHGLHLMNALLGDFEDDGTPHFIVNPRCQRFAEFCEKFAGDRKDPLKDVGDGGRYILEKAIKELPSMRLIARY